MTSTEFFLYNLRYYFVSYREQMFKIWGVWLGWLRNSILTISRSTKFCQNYSELTRNFTKMESLIREIFANFWLISRNFRKILKYFSDSKQTLTYERKLTFFIKNAISYIIWHIEFTLEAKKRHFRSMY